VGIGNVMGQALRGAAASGQPQAGGGDAIPDVMTPGEAAKVLKVSEEDVMSAIDSGDLKAKKLGKAYRISKESLDDFLGS
jgi:excisionase family DNA binding protein